MIAVGTGAFVATRIETKQDYAYRVLKEQISSGLLLPGQRIVVNRVANDIGTSAIPVREALFRLESERLVTIRPHIGAIVALLTKSTVLETLENLAVLEGYATRLATPRAHEIRSELEAADADMLAAIGREDWETFSARNRSFHFTIYGVCGNAVLVDTITSLWAQLDTFMSGDAFNLMPDRASGSIAEHEQIVRALCDADADPMHVELLARTHKFNTVKRLTES